jgi:hypothetical protein
MSRTPSPPAQIHFYLDAELKAEIDEYCRSEGETFGEFFIELAREKLGKDAGSSGENEERRITRELDRTLDDLRKLQDPRNEKNVHLRLIANIIHHYYTTGDWKTKRALAIRDYRGKQGPWSVLTTRTSPTTLGRVVRSPQARLNELRHKPNDEAEIVLACQIAEQIDSLAARRAQLVSQLNPSSGTDAEPSTTLPETMAQAASLSEREPGTPDNATDEDEWKEDDNSNDGD